MILPHIYPDSLFNHFESQIFHIKIQHTEIHRSEVGKERLPLRFYYRTGEQNLEHLKHGL